MRGRAGRVAVAERAGLGAMRGFGLVMAGASTVRAGSDVPEPGDCASADEIGRIALKQSAASSEVPRPDDSASGAALTGELVITVRSEPESTVLDEFAIMPPTAFRLCAVLLNMLGGLVLARRERASWLP